MTELWQKRMSTAPCLMWKPLSASLVICYAPVGAVTVPLLPDAVPRESSRNSCLPQPPDTSYPGCVARCTRPALARFCSMVAKRGDQRNPSRGGYTAMIRWICSIKDRDKTTSASLLQKFGIEDITSFLRCRRLGWYGHVQRVTSCNKTITNFQIIGTKKKGQPRKTWSVCVKTDVNECGPAGVDSLTEMHEEPVVDIAWRCQPCRMGHRKHLNMKWIRRWNRVSLPVISKRPCAIKVVTKYVYFYFTSYHISRMKHHVLLRFTLKQDKNILIFTGDIGPAGNLARQKDKSLGAMILT